jgi:hypothetical protein
MLVAIDEAVAKLIEIAGPEIGRKYEGDPDEEDPLREVGEVLDRKNGFYALESALHVFPAGGVELPERSLQQWNSPGLWTACYPGGVADVFYFAEDIFGGQFGLLGSRVYSLDPETGEISQFSQNVRGWCVDLLERYNYATGYAIGHVWQEKHGALRPGHRLMPRIPFCLGGGFSADNVVPVESVASMRYRASIAKQINKMSDGVKIRFDPSVVDRLACDRKGVAGDGMCGCYG